MSKSGYFLINYKGFLIFLFNVPTPSMKSCHNSWPFAFNLLWVWPYAAVFFMVMEDLRWTTTTLFFPVCRPALQSRECLWWHDHMQDCQTGYEEQHDSVPRWQRNISPFVSVPLYVTQPTLVSVLSCCLFFFGRCLIISLTQWDNQTAWPPEEKFEIFFRSVVRVLPSELVTTLWCHVYCNDMISWQALTHKGTFHFFFGVLQNTKGELSSRAEWKQTETSEGLKGYLRIVASAYMQFQPHSYLHWNECLSKWD